MGSIYNSKYRSGPLIEMHRKLKTINGTKNITPGPGAYQHFSQFGIWVPKNRTNGYNVRKRLNSANSYKDNIKNYFRKKMERAVTENNSRNKKRRILTALR